MTSTIPPGGERERCEVCDRADCPVIPFHRMEHDEFDATAGIPGDEKYEAYLTLDRDCRNNAVDWRARALAAESRLAAPPLVEGGPPEPPETYAAELENLCILMQEELAADIDGCDVGADRLRAAACVALRKRDATVAKIANWLRSQSFWTPSAEALADEVTRGAWRGAR